MKKLQFLKAGDYMKTITRAKYLDRIIELNGTPDIKIITGIRRSGKSKLMQAYIAYLKNNFENINIIFIDFMDLALSLIHIFFLSIFKYFDVLSAVHNFLLSFAKYIQYSRYIWFKSYEK